MKKFLMFSAALAFAVTASAAAAAPSGDPITISSANILGIQRTAKGQNSTVVAVPFQAVGGGDVSLKDTLYTDNLSLADTVMAMQNSDEGYYTQWIWLPGLMTDLYWTQRYNGEGQVLPQDQLLSYGAGLKLELAKASTPVYTLGEYSDAPKTFVLMAFTTSYLVNPSTTESMNLNDVFKGEWDSFMDFIIVPDGAKEVTYSFDSNGDGSGNHWYRSVKTQSIVNGVIQTKSVPDFNIPKVGPGVGFRYVRGGFSDMTVSW